MAVRDRLAARAGSGNEWADCGVHQCPELNENDRKRQWTVANQCRCDWGNYGGCAEDEEREFVEVDGNHVGEVQLDFRASTSASVTLGQPTGALSNDVVSSSSASSMASVARTSGLNATISVDVP